MMILVYYIIRLWCWFSCYFYLKRSNINYILL